VKGGNVENSILDTTKKILGISPEYKAFDLDVITHLNAALAVVAQLGVGPADGLFVEDETTQWGDLAVPANQLNLVKSYVFLKVRILFDPPSTSFHTESMQNQIREMEWRLNVFREETEWVLPLK
jgi:hypothetical protein